jgi:hypothetical protein
MTTDWLNTILIAGSLLSATAAFIYLAVKVGSSPSRAGKEKEYGKEAEQDVEHIFNEDFREELRNRGRLHFEKIIGENAMFLQQDLRLTTSQINEHMKQEINKTLQEAFSKYEESIGDAKQIALDSIQKTRDAVERQRQMMNEQLQKEVDQEKQRIIERFEQNMAAIINHYVLEAVGNQISLEDQLEFILSELERNKKEIIEDINSGA